MTTRLAISQSLDDSAALPLPAAANAQGSRGAILRESLALFAKHGYGATSVRDIAAQVGMMAGSLYSHFTSKEMILAELVHAGQAEHSRRLRAAVLSCPPGPKNQLIALVRAHVLFHTEFTTLAIVANAEVHVLDAALSKPALDLRTQNFQLLKDIIERGVRLGVFEVTDLVLTATIIGSMGARVANWYTPQFHLGANVVAEQLAEVACRIVGATDRPRAAPGTRRRAAKK